MSYLMFAVRPVNSSRFFVSANFLGQPGVMLADHLFRTREEAERHCATMNRYQGKGSYTVASVTIQVDA